MTKDRHKKCIESHSVPLDYNFDPLYAHSHSYSHSHSHSALTEAGTSFSEIGLSSNAAPNLDNGFSSSMPSSSIGYIKSFLRNFDPFRFVHSSSSSIVNSNSTGGVCIYIILNLLYLYYNSDRKTFVSFISTLSSLVLSLLVNLKIKSLNYLRLFVKKLEIL